MRFHAFIIMLCVTFTYKAAAGTFFDCIKGFMRASRAPVTQVGRPLRLANPSGEENQVLSELTSFHVETQSGKSRQLSALLGNQGQTDRSSRESLSLAAEYGARIMRLGAYQFHALDNTRENLRRVLGLIKQAESARKSFRSFQTDILDLHAGLSGSIFDLLCELMARFSSGRDSISQMSLLANTLTGDRYSKNIAIRVLEAELNILDALAATTPDELMDVSQQLQLLSRRIVEAPRERLPL